MIRQGISGPAGPGIPGKKGTVQTMQTILVCDDDKQIVDAIDIYLTGEGFRVLKAYDGYEALEILEIGRAHV